MLFTFHIGVVWLQLLSGHAPADVPAFMLREMEWPGLGTARAMCMGAGDEGVARLLAQRTQLVMDHVCGRGPCTGP